MSEGQAGKTGDARDLAHQRARYGAVKRVFEELVSLPADERSPRLAELAERDPELAEEVETLLAAEQTLDAPRLEGVQVYREIDEYRLLEQIGAGGMGEVYLAEQLRPVRRRVALKLVRSDFDSAEITARFEGERQALALMEHPAIARVFAAGSTAEGRPYFVMEYVAGQPITAFCDQQRFDRRQRLEVFRQVCDAVAHAHLKGIIHRDLKPSNVLVSEQDGEVRVKIIDFGIAKAVGQRLTGRTLHTAVGKVVGTPEYMSPEQASTSPHDVDVRTDVYSLGVMLYELLVGVRPFEEEADTSGYEEMRRRLGEEEPLRPSTRVSNLASSHHELWRRRRTSAEDWARGLRGDLDWICLKALERDRTRRYQSAAALSEDLRRTLADEPVLAGPPSWLYRARKFAKRHRAAVVASAVVAATLVVAVVGIVLALGRALVAEDRAVAEAQSSNQVVEFLVETFRLVDPTRAPEEPVDARELLDRGVERLREDFAERPLVQARLLGAFGSIYANLGELGDAEVLAEAVEILERELGPESPQLASALSNLSELRFNQGRYEEAERHARRALQLQDTFDDAAGREARLHSLSALANLLIRTERLEEAERTLERAVEEAIELYGANAWELVQLYNNLGLVDFERGDHAAAAERFEQALRIGRQRYDGDHPWIASMLNNLGGLSFALERYPEGAEFLRQAVSMRSRLLAPDHPDLAVGLANLAQAEIVLGNYEAAEELLERSQSILEDSGIEPQLLAQIELNYGLLYREQGQWERAVVHYRRAVRRRSETLGADSAAVGEALLELATALEGAGRLEEAREAKAQGERLSRATKTGS